MQCSKVRTLKRYSFFDKRYMKGVPFLCGIHKGKGLELGAEPSRTKLCRVSPQDANKHARGYFSEIYFKN